jgi:hypothetical protein
MWGFTVKNGTVPGTSGSLACKLNTAIGNDKDCKILKIPANPDFIDKSIKSNASFC